MRYSPHALRALSVAAQCDPRTATRWLAGLPVLPAYAHRLAACAAELGMTRTNVPAAASPFDGAPQPMGITSVGWNGPR